MIRDSDTTDFGSSDELESATEISAVLERLGKFTVEEKVGSGGMGSVYRAYDVEKQQVVALKVISNRDDQEPARIQRLQAEARAVSQMEHENIVSLYEAGQIDGRAYLSLEFVDGEDVHQLIARDGPLSVERSVEIIKQATSALAHCYERGFVHRDVKPSNLIVRHDGVVKLTDLGLVRWMEETSDLRLTESGITLGTADYISPEQACNSKAADIRSDIYSLGCTWYQMLTGEPPFADHPVTKKLQAHLSTVPPDPRHKNDAITDSVVAILHKMLSKSPDDRYQTPMDLLTDLESTALTRQEQSETLMALLGEDEGEYGLRPLPGWSAARPTVHAPPAADRPLPLNANAGAASDELAEPSDEILEFQTENHQAARWVKAALILAALVFGIWWLALQSGSQRESPAQPVDENPFDRAQNDGDF